MDHLYNLHAEGIYRYCCLKTSDSIVAKEFTQETFARALGYIASGKVINYPKAFLYTVAKHLIIDWYKVRNRTVSLEKIVEMGLLPEEGGSVTAPENYPGETLDYLNYLSTLDKGIFLLHYIEGFKLREVGEIIGKSENAIAVRIHRGLKKLRKVMEPELIAY